MNIIHLVLQNVSNREQQQKIVYEFAHRLAPKDLVHLPVPRPYMKYCLFLPLLNFEERLFWLLVERNNSIEIIPADGRSNTIFATTEQVMTRGEREKKKLVVSNSIFHFPSAKAADLWDKRQAERDPLISFISCFRESTACPGHFPASLRRQLFDAVGATDLVLACAICAAIPQNQRELITHVVSVLGQAETLCVFLRSEFTKDVTMLQDPSRIFRDNSIRMAATGILLREHGQALIDELVDVMEKYETAGPISVLMNWFPILRRMPQLNRIILRSAFLAARRKFPDKLVPLTALGGVLMLRFVMADVGARLPKTTKLLQRMINISVFAGQMRSEYDQKDFDVIAQFLSEMSELKGNHVPKDYYSSEELMNVIAADVDDIIAHIRKAGDQSWPHPAVFSIQELIETGFMGADEQPQKRLVGASLW
jgi:hypothetical protein